MKKSLCAVCLVLCCRLIHAQSQFSGDLQLDANFYQRDTLIGASGNPLYDNLLSGVNGWLTVNYQNEAAGIEAGVRLDVFNNSELRNPGVPYTGEGIGRFYVSKKIDALKITGGYIYDQFASGLVYRAYEERALGIDNALLGVELQYGIGENWTIKALAGKEKNQFSTYDPVLKGGNIEGTITKKNLLLTPGIAVLNRTIDNADMTTIVSIINGQPLETRFCPKFNLYAGSIYNTLAWKDVSWYIEYAMKSSEAIKDYDGSLINSDGNVLYTNLTYSHAKEGKGFGITGQYRHVDHWVLRTSPNEVLLNGILDYLPSLTKQNSLRLTARYQAVAQELGEDGYELNATYTPIKSLTLTGNYSYVMQPDNTELFREVYADFEIKKTKWKLEGGAQYVEYNQSIIENHPGVPMVKPITPFAELTYKFNRKKSMRIEVQYQKCDQDFGSWLFALLEYNIAPKWSFAVSDMWTYDPLKTEDALHYPNVFVAFTQRSNRFTLSYVKQTEGIVCTGGICRFEPAFSGFKLGIVSTF